MINFCRIISNIFTKLPEFNLICIVQINTKIKVAIIFEKIEKDWINIQLKGSQFICYTT
jgi:hypothetical protein